MSTLVGYRRLAWAVPRLCYRSSTSRSLRSPISIVSRRNLAPRRVGSSSIVSLITTKGEMSTAEPGEVAQMVAGSYSEELDSAIKAVRLASTLCQVNLSKPRFASRPWTMLLQPGV